MPSQEDYLDNLLKGIGRLLIKFTSINTYEV